MRTSRTSRAAGFISPRGANTRFGTRQGSRSVPRFRPQSVADGGGIFDVTDGGQAPEQIGDDGTKAAEFPVDSALVDEAKMLKIEEAR